MIAGAWLKSTTAMITATHNKTSAITVGVWIARLALLNGDHNSQS